MTEQLQMQFGGAWAVRSDFVSYLCCTGTRIGALACHDAFGVRVGA